MWVGIKNIFFIVLFGITFLSTGLNAAPKSLETCLNEISPRLEAGTERENQRRSCYLSDIRNGLNIKSSPNTFSDKIGGSYSIDFGLGQPLFSGLKQKRDKFIYDYIDKNISKVKKIQRENIRRFNLQTLVRSNSGEPEIIGKLKKIFNLTSIEEMIRSFRAKRLDKCEKSSKSKMDGECSKEEDPYMRQRCETDAQSIMDNCFKYTTESTALKNLQGDLQKMEDGILGRIAELSFIKSEEIDGAISSIMSKASGIDGKISALNRATNLEFDGKIGELLSGDSTYAIEKMIAEKSGISMEFVGPNAWKLAENRNGSLLNYRLSVNSTKINNICDLTKCLVYPSSKRYYTDDQGNQTATDDYKKMCLDANLTEEYLNQLVNEARKKLTRIMSQLVLKEIMVRIGVDAYLDEARNALICGQAATSKTISDGMNSVFGDGKEFDFAGALGDAVSTGAPKQEAFAKKANICLQNHMEKIGKISEGEFGLVKCGGVTKTVYVATGSAHMPFSCPKGQVKVSMGNLFLGAPKDKAAIESCMAEGETATWLENYKKCNAADADFKFGKGFGSDLFQGLGKLFKDMDTQSLFQCEGLLSTNRRSSYGATVNIKINPLMAESSRDSDAIFMAVKSKLMQASRVLFSAKINASMYFATENMICADRALSVLKRNAYYTDFEECKILDHELDQSLIEENVPTIKVENLLSGIQLPKTASSPPINLLPSVIDLCTNSANYVIDNLKDEYPIGDTSKITTPTDPRSPGSSISDNSIPVSRAISNVNKCSIFFNDIELVLPRGNVNLDSIVEKNRFSKWVDAQETEKSYIDGILINDSLFHYKSTIDMLHRRSELEKFNICIKNNIRDWADKPTLVRKARNDYCKDYRISLFDRYYDDAATSFNYPITDDHSRLKVDKYIDSQERKYEGGTW